MLCATKGILGTTNQLQPLHLPMRLWRLFFTSDGKYSTCYCKTKSLACRFLHLQHVIYSRLNHSVSCSQVNCSNVTNILHSETSDFSKTMRPASIFPIQDLSFELSTLRQEDIDSLQETDPVSLARLLVQLPESFIQELSRDETGHSVCDVF